VDLSPYQNCPPLLSVLPATYVSNSSHPSSVDLRQLTEATSA